MKKYSHHGSGGLFSAIALALISIAPALAADPFGTWLTGEKKARSSIVNCGGALCGNLVWLLEPNDPDDQQSRKPTSTMPTPAKKRRPLLGIPIVLSMKPEGADQVEGNVYNA